MFGKGKRDQDPDEIAGVVWWDDNGPRGHSKPMRRSEAEAVKKAFRNEDKGRHAVVVKRPRR